VPLLATIDGIVVDLTIDLLYEDPDGWVLLFGERQHWSEGAQGQAEREMVARAFARTTGLKVSRADLIREWPPFG
jgi:hypothetical protein